MRISDWSSDVCSSDLRLVEGDVGPLARDIATVVGPLRGNVLLADDTAELRELVGLYIASIAPDVQVVSVENGARAVERALIDDFDLIVMDLQMPEMDGFSAAHLLRASGYRGPMIAQIGRAHV